MPDGQSAPEVSDRVLNSVFHSHLGMNHIIKPKLNYIFYPKNESGFRLQDAEGQQVNRLPGAVVDMPHVQCAH
jgi:hypothetical protein